MAAAAAMYDIFLCHNRADKEWTEHLGAQIESETFDGAPSGRKLRVFLDKWDIAPGQNIIEVINQGLERARYIGVILSPEAVKAPWPWFEWTHVVAGDPMNRERRVIPIVVRQVSLDGKERLGLPAPFRALHWIDFSDPKRFKPAFLELISVLRDEAPRRGPVLKPIASAAPTVLPSLAPTMASAPDKVTDLLVGNLLPVTDYPRTVWSGATDLRTAAEVFSRAKDATGFDLQEKRLYAFGDLSLPENPLRALVDAGSIRTEKVAEWQADPVRSLWFMAMVNRCLSVHCRKFLSRDTKGRWFFLPDAALSPRVVKHGVERGRKVAAPKTHVATGAPFWVHLATRMRFHTLGDRLFLLIEPCYLFTRDGREALDAKAVGFLSAKWSGKERNAAILRHVVFWLRTLTKSRKHVEIGTGCGARPLVIAGVPALARTQFGVSGDFIGIKSLLAQVSDDLDAVGDLAAASSSLAPPEAEEETDAESAGEA
ncbi:MAG: toll/interleukin-1 receptor domain-containing protein [Planctomycetota bacterium]|nr:toll/interleukin-1 receptor domain-containing protein [Planctomycetota bacterium]